MAASNRCVHYAGDTTCFVSIISSIHNFNRTSRRNHILCKHGMDYSFGFILPISSEYNYILKIAFSLLNLELGFELCFYKGMTMSIKTGLQFMFPIYLWLLVLIMSLISRFSNKFANLTVNYSVQVLSTLLYLSFSKLVLTIIDIFIPASVYTPSETLTVWYSDGNVSYWNDTGHLILLIISFMLSVLNCIEFF